MVSGTSVEAQHLCVDYPLSRPSVFSRWLTRRATSVTRQRWQRALSDVTFRADAGERIGVVGLNGAGKSTLFRTIAGILSPAQGNITVGTVPAGNPFRLPVGYMTTHPLLYRRLTGYENLRYIADLYNIAHAEDRMDMLIERVGLTARIHAYVEQYSTGMIARLDLARVLLPNPPVLLLDEPFGSFDVRFVEEARAIIKETQATVFIATHNIEDIEVFTHRILLLHEGRLMKDVRFSDLSEVAPKGARKPLTITEFVQLLLRQSALGAQSHAQSVYHKHVLTS